MAVTKTQRSIQVFAPGAASRPEAFRWDDRPTSGKWELLKDGLPFRADEADIDIYFGDRPDGKKWILVFPGIAPVVVRRSTNGVLLPTLAEVKSVIWAVKSRVSPDVKTVVLFRLGIESRG